MIVPLLMFALTTIALAAGILFGAWLERANRPPDRRGNGRRS